jgi:ribosome-binding factor A
MKFKKRLPGQIRSACNEIQPDDGVDPRTFFRRPSRKGANRKALQLCSQIAQTLTSVLDWETGDDRLRGLTVQSVEPAPDSSCVLVTLCWQATTDNADAGEVLEGLRRSSGYFRTQIAAAIHRKRVPQLLFRISGRGEVNL